MTYYKFECYPPGTLADVEVIVDVYDYDGEFGNLDEAVGTAVILIILIYVLLPLIIIICICVCICACSKSCCFAPRNT